MGFETWSQAPKQEDGKIIRESQDESKHGIKFAEGAEPNTIIYINQVGERFGETNLENVLSEAEQNIKVMLGNIATTRKMYEAIIAGGETVDVKKEMIDWIDGDVEAAFLALRNRTRDMYMVMAEQLKAKGKGVAIENGPGGKNVLKNL